MSAIQGLSSGKGGGSQGGGLSPQEMALMEFQGSQQKLKTADLFGSHGMGMSTGASYMSGANEMGAAAFGAQMADQNAAAAENQNIDLASLAGSVAGQQGGSTSTDSSGSTPV
jgi:hypothetical protein